MLQNIYKIVLNLEQMWNNNMGVFLNNFKGYQEKTLIVLWCFVVVLIFSYSLSNSIYSAIDSRTKTKQYQFLGLAFLSTYIFSYNKLPYNS